LVDQLWLFGLVKETMTKGLWIYVCFMFLMIIHHFQIANCFYLPGVAPEDFHKVIFIYYQMHACMHACVIDELHVNALFSI
jgi:hypothetical protein